MCSIAFLLKQFSLNLNFWCMCTFNQIIFHNSRRSKWISAVRSTLCCHSLGRNTCIHQKCTASSTTSAWCRWRGVLNTSAVGINWILVVLLPSHLNKSTSQWRLSLRREWNKQRWSLLNQTVCFRGPSTSKQTGCFILKHQARVKAAADPAPYQLYLSHSHTIHMSLENVGLQFPVSLCHSD